MTEWTEEELVQIRQHRADVLAFLERAGRTALRAPSLMRTSDGRPAPLSFAQEQLWLLEQVRPGGTAYNIPLAVRLHGVLNLAALCRSLQTIVARHESLRTRFEWLNGVPVQVVDPPGSFRVAVTDLCGLTPRDRLEKAGQLQRMEALWRFDLARGPLIRACLLRLESQRHVLLVTLHHIVADGWSIGVLTREFSELYRAHSRGEQPSLPGLPVQYADYALWQRQWLQGAELERHLAYWREQLKSIPDVLQLPTDRPRPLFLSYEGATLPISIDESVHLRLQQLCRQEGVTVYIVLLATFKLLLSRYSGQDDIVVGSPIAGRAHPATELLIGFFVNILVMRTGLSERWTVRELLQNVRQVALDAYAHQDLPFEKLVSELHIERAASWRPICQVMLVMQNAPDADFKLDGCQLQSLANEQATAKFDLTLNFNETRAGLCGQLEYSTQLFDRWRMQRLLQHFGCLLEQIVAAPDRQLQRLTLTGAVELDQLRHWNETGTDYPRCRPVYRRIEEQAVRTPDALAVMFEQQHLSYARLEARANQLSRYLRALGVLEEDRVGICVARGLDMMVAVLGVMKAGAAYVPLDPDYPPESLGHMLQDAGARVLLVQRRLRNRVPACAALLVELDAGWGEIARYEDTSLPPCRRDEADSHLAYVIYTSGSTGRPKGVMVEHGGLSNYLEFSRRHYATAGGFGAAVISSFAFDATITGLYTPLLCGQTVVLVGQGREMEGLRELLRALIPFTFIKISPAFLQLLGEQLSATGDVCRVSAFVVGGEALSRATVELWRSYGPRVRLINEYGPTETVVGCTYHELDRRDGPQVPVPIGRPIANARIYILDSCGHPVPVGAVGEIHVGGGGVARGYLNQAAATARQFQPDPYDSEGKARLYRTGDLGRFRADGIIEYLGRSDQQIKLRGYRIEPGEIEALLMSHPRVAQALVVSRGETPLDRRLVVYLTCAGDVVPDAWELYTWLRKSLPPYMIPTAFVTLESLPRTINGKLDRQGLPAPPASALLTRQYEAPAKGLETTLAGIWQEALQVERVGRNDNFFELGGHSLLALNAQSRINSTLGCQLLATDVYQFPTVGQLAGRIRAGVASTEFVRLSTEVVLDDELHPRRPAARPGVAGNGTLLTGSTGFVGRFLLAHLLQNTDVTVYCPVRAATREQAFFRVRSTLSAWDLWREEFGARIVAMPGDLRQPRLGLGSSMYEAVCRDVGIVYHSACSVNFLETYSMARPANVDGSRELLKLAATGAAKVINYISSLGVFSTLGIHGERLVDETTSTQHEMHPDSNGYEATKWVAEHLFLKAREHGIPCNIFRLGLVWADTRQGRYDERQWDYRLIKSCLLSGYGIANYRYEMAPIPVDYAVQALVLLGNKYRDGGGIFHLRAESQAIGGLFESCNELIAMPLELMPYGQWSAEIRKLHRQGVSLPIAPLLDGHEVSLHDRHGAPRAGSIRFDCTRTREELEAAGVTAPVFSRDLLQVLLASMLRRDRDLCGERRLRRANA